MLGAISSALCQGFLARRCLKFARLTRTPQDRGSVKALISYYGLGGILVGGVLSTLGTGIATAAQLWNLPSLSVNLSSASACH